MGKANEGEYVVPSEVAVAHMTGRGVLAGRAAARALEDGLPKEEVAGAIRLLGDLIDRNVELKGELDGATVRLKRVEQAAVDLERLVVDLRARCTRKETDDGQ
jgi:hypothetical protein